MVTHREDHSVPALPEGVEVRPLEPHDDDRGRFTELYRDSWETGDRPVQWNLVRSAAGVLRGVHAHRRHSDVLTVAAGQLVLGLVDLRSGAPERPTVLTLDADHPRLVSIPPGVAHGFWFPTASIHVYAVSDYFDPADELGCKWNDPGLGIPWSPGEVQISARDAALPSLSTLLDELRR
jgi:dTDP-4-dehydrorhamnose 3,5-epimerase